jgi:hypothetical protein
MNRRLYFLIPDRDHALTVVDDLVENGIDIERMHAIGDRRTVLDGLPNASLRQHRDSASRVEKVIWSSNLVCFGLALVATLVLPILIGLSWWLLLPIGVMAACFMAGLHFTSIPNTHLGEFRDALSHGEILLVVDVPETRVAEVEDNIHHRHPEATVGGVGWSTQAFDL